MAASFPRKRMRRNRREPWIRRLVAEHRLSADDLIWPVFVVEGENKREPVPSMPGVERLSVDLLAGAVEDARELGIPAVALFPYTDDSLKTPDAKEAYNPDNLVCRAVRAATAAVPRSGYGRAPRWYASTIVIPKDHTSDAVVYLPDSIASGAVHRTGNTPAALR